MSSPPRWSLLALSPRRSGGRSGGSSSTIALSSSRGRRSPFCSIPALVITSAPLSPPSVIVFAIVFVIVFSQLSPRPLDRVGDIVAQSLHGVQGAVDRIGGEFDRIVDDVPLGVGVRGIDSVVVVVVAVVVIAASFTAPVAAAAVVVVATVAILPSRLPRAARRRRRRVLPPPVVIAAPRCCSAASASASSSSGRGQHEPRRSPRTGGMDDFGAPPIGGRVPGGEGVAHGGGTSRRRTVAVAFFVVSVFAAAVEVVFSFSVPITVSGRRRASAAPVAVAVAVDAVIARGVLLARRRRPPPPRLALPVDDRRRTPPPPPLRSAAEGTFAVLIVAERRGASPTMRRPVVRSWPCLSALWGDPVRRERGRIRCF
mmetsp:Transcript_28660/g.84466  ORF Transcript_28660/g.84466 Transcript_28660/m.84466 type:complete len:371 (+) Transcript_28660:885-1997(+)